MDEIRRELVRSPEGLPLLFIVPKQFTFQIERQLLADVSLSGYTRLYILSFERLAQYLIRQCPSFSAEILNEGGRVMALRALLSRHYQELKSFHTSARRAGFAVQLSELLKELQAYGMSHQKVELAIERSDIDARLREKLSDIMLIWKSYLEWLRNNGLRDESSLLEVAREAINENNNIRFGGVWLDGFAKLSYQEITLLGEVIKRSDSATLAFCVDSDSISKKSLFARGYMVGNTYLRCREYLEAIGCRTWVEILTGEVRRFQAQDIDLLSKSWGDFGGQTYAIQLPQNDREWLAAGGIRIVVCANPIAEAVLAARTIRKYVRGGGRYKEVAVLTRRLDNYAELLRRIFLNYQIPFFLDRRESVSHHPLAELIRYAIRIALYNWRINDLFGALKTGFASATDAEIDWLENEALANGWEGNAWQMPLSFAEDNQSAEILERLRQKLIAPFAKFCAAVKGSQDGVSGENLINAIKELFAELKVEDTLNRWYEESQKRAMQTHIPPSVHQTILEEIEELFENVKIAFGGETRALEEWQEILEAGLCGLTVGVIPPSLDQVLIGAIDRSRNPDLKLAIVIGLNESVFPEPPQFSPLLNESDREILKEKNLFDGDTFHSRLAEEWYYGYIAMTRSSKYLLLTYSASDWRGRPLNPSPFISHLQAIFLDLKLDKFAGVPIWTETEHIYELVGILSGEKVPAALEQLPAVQEVRKQLISIHKSDTSGILPEPIVDVLFGNNLRISVSGLDDYAGCPFKYFVRYVLRAEERELFEIDVKHLGRFQHSALEIFHKTLVSQGKKWRDLECDEAATLMRDICKGLVEEYHNKLFKVSPSNIFQAEVLSKNLEDFIKVSVYWMRTSYSFDPEYVELGFGLQDTNHEAYKVEVNRNKTLYLCGRIDRIDVCLPEESESALAVIIDYKSSLKKLDNVLLKNGLQLQLPLYLLVANQLPLRVNGRKLKPIGVFYLNLRGKYASGKTRDEVLLDTIEAQLEAYKHHGRFDSNYREYLDSRQGGKNSGQFVYRLKQGGGYAQNNTEAMTGEDFQTLVDNTKEFIIKIGRGIFSGRFTVDPWRKINGDSACDNCIYANICRIDRLSHRWRVVK